MKIELIDELDRRYGPDWDRRFRLLDLDALLGPPLDTSSDQS